MEQILSYPSMILGQVERLNIRATLSSLAKPAPSILGIAAFKLRRTAMALFSLMHVCQVSLMEAMKCFACQQTRQTSLNTSTSTSEHRRRK